MRRPLSWSVTCTLLAGGTLLAHAAARAEGLTIVSFERVRIGTVPSGFRALTSDEAEPGRWEVVRIDGTPALSQTDAGRAGYRLAVLGSPRLKDVRAGVRLRMGPGDRAAGLAWRVHDASNYYAARLDLKSEELVLYKFVRGNRVRLSRLRDLRLDAAEWHDLAIEHVGDRIKVWLNGIPVAAERDGALSDAGMLALWTLGDSTAHFARLSFEPVRRN